MKKIIALAGATLSALVIGCAPVASPITHHAATPASQPTTQHAGKPGSQPGAHRIGKAGSQPGAHHAAKPDSQSEAHHAAKAPAVTQLTDRQTCLYLRDDIVRNGGTPRTKTLRYLAARGPHWVLGLPGSPSLWESAITDVREGQTSKIRVDLAKFSSFCRLAGVQIPQE